MAVGTRSTTAAGNDAANDNTAGGGSDVNMTGDSLSAGTGSATLGYNVNTLYALYFVTVVLLLRIKYFVGSSSSSNYEVVACIILVLVYWLSFLWNNAWCKMTKYPIDIWHELARSFEMKPIHNSLNLILSLNHQNLLRALPT